MRRLRTLLYENTIVDTTPKSSSIIAEGRRSDSPERPERISAITQASGLSLMTVRAMQSLLLFLHPFAMTDVWKKLDDSTLHLAEAPAAERVVRYLATHITESFAEVLMGHTQPFFEVLV